MTPASKTILILLVLPNTVFAGGFVGWILWRLSSHQPALPKGALPVLIGLYAVMFIYNQWAARQLRKRRETEGPLG